MMMIDEAVYSTSAQILNVTILAIHHWLAS
jgi:hypothetical protein